MRCAIPLLGGAVWDLAGVAGIENSSGSRAVEIAVRFAGGLAILGINVMLVWNYGSKPTGIRAYETFLRWMIRLTMLAFLIVVVVQLFKGRLDFGAILRGFFTIQIPDRPGALTTVLGAIGAAVRRDYSVMGDAVNTASRLEAAADPGTILASADFKRRVSRQFAFGPARLLHLKGKELSLIHI